MNLEAILKKRGINLYNEEGELRNVVDFIEDLYLKLSLLEISLLMREFEEEEQYSNIFDNARGRKYEG